MWSITAPLRNLITWKIKFYQVKKGHSGLHNKKNDDLGIQRTNLPQADLGEVEVIQHWLSIEVINP